MPPFLVTSSMGIPSFAPDNRQPTLGPQESALAPSGASASAELHAVNGLCKGTGE